MDKIREYDKRMGVPNFEGWQDREAQYETYEEHETKYGDDSKIWTVMFVLFIIISVILVFIKMNS